MVLHIREAPSSYLEQLEKTWLSGLDQVRLPCRLWLEPLGTCAVSTYPEVTGGRTLLSSWVFLVP